MTKPKPEGDEQALYPVGGESPYQNVSYNPAPVKTDHDNFAHLKYGWFSERWI